MTTLVLDALTVMRAYVRWRMESYVSQRQSQRYCDDLELARRALDLLADPAPLAVNALSCLSGVPPGAVRRVLLALGGKTETPLLPPLARGAG